MWRFLTTISIARRLMISAALTALIPGIIIATLGGSYIGTLQTVNSAVTASDEAVKLATDMQADLLRMNALLGTLNTAPDSAVSNVQNSNEIRQLVENFATSLATYQQSYQITTSANMKSIRDTLQGNTLGTQASISQHSMIYVVDLQWGIYRDAQNQVLALLPKNAGAETLAGSVAQANLEYLPLKGNLDNLVSLTESISQVVGQINTFKINPIFFLTVAAFFVSTLVVFAISYLINLTITRPLRQLVHLTERIAQGETDARAGVSGHDEISMVATSMNTMLDSIVKLMQNVQRQHEVLEERVKELIGEVKCLATGDLRVRAEVTPDALGFLAHALNYTIDELSNLVARTKTATGQIDTLTITMQADMHHLVEIGDARTRHMTEAVDIAEQITDAAVTLTEQSQHLVTRARQAHQAHQVHQVHQAAQTSIQDTHDSPQDAPVLRATFADFEQQTRAIEDLNTGLNQQVASTHRVLRALLKAAETDRACSEGSREMKRHIDQLTNLVTHLRMAVGAFKLSEEDGFSERLN